MATHLENLAKILEFIVEETFPHRMIDILYGRIKFMVEKHITLRDLENFIAYFKFVVSSSPKPNKLKFEPKLIQDFIDRSYADFIGLTQRFRAKQLYGYLKHKINRGAEISNQDIKLLEIILKQERTSTLDKLMERVRIATILKWLQGPLEDQLSKGLRDYIVFLATIYGQYRTNRVFDVEWHPYEVSKKDTDLIDREYKIFEAAIIEAVQTIRKSKIKNSNPDKYEEQFRVVFDSLDNLIKMNEKGELTPTASFKDKIIVSTALIYIQDELVEKDAELKKFIELLVSLYYQFRDKHYTPIA